MLVHISYVPHRSNIFMQGEKPTLLVDSHKKLHSEYAQALPANNMGIHCEGRLLALNWTRVKVYQHDKNLSLILLVSMF